MLQKPKKLKNAQDSRKKSVGALLCSEGINAGLFLVGGFCTWDMCRYYSLCNQFQLIDALKPGGLDFWESFQKLLQNYSFLRILFTKQLPEKQLYIWQLHITLSGGKGVLLCSV